MWNETSSSPEIPHSRATLSATNGMVGTEHRAERTGARFGLFDAFLVEIVAEDIDAIRAGQIVEDIAVDIGDRTPADDCMNAPVPRCSRTSRLY
jgi:hypothetical protein